MTYLIRVQLGEDFCGKKKSTYNQSEIEIKWPVMPNNFVSKSRLGSNRSGPGIIVFESGDSFNLTY